MSDIPPSPTIVIHLTPDRAADLSAALADALCWFAGFQAARPDDGLVVDREPLRRLNIELKDAIEARGRT